VAAFQAYEGTYADDFGSFRWKCYATARVHEIRTFGGPLPCPPEDRKWVRKSQYASGDHHLAVLVDASTDDFSQMLSQIHPISTAALA
jgi:hypothetical protein